MKPFMPGVLLLLRKAGPTIVPVGIAGTHEALPRGRRLPIPTLSPLFMPAGPSTVAVSVGKPVSSKRFATCRESRSWQNCSSLVKTEQERARCSAVQVDLTGQPAMKKFTMKRSTGCGRESI